MNGWTFSPNPRRRGKKPPTAASSGLDLQAWCLFFLIFYLSLFCSCSSCASEVRRLRKKLPRSDSRPATCASDAVQSLWVWEVCHHQWPRWHHTGLSRHGESKCFGVGSLAGGPLWGGGEKVEGGLGERGWGCSWSLMVSLEKVTSTTSSIGSSHNHHFDFSATILWYFYVSMLPAIMPSFI